MAFLPLDKESLHNRRTRVKKWRSGGVSSAAHVRKERTPLCAVDGVDAVSFGRRLWSGAVCGRKRLCRSNFGGKQPVERRTRGLGALVNADGCAVVGTQTRTSQT